MSTVDAVPAAMDVTFEGFDLKVGVPDDEAGANMIINRVVREYLGTGWKIRPNTIDPRQFDVLPDGATVTVPEAWDKARAIAADRDVVWAEPILRTPNLAAERTAIDVVQTSERTVRGGGSEARVATKANWHILHCHIDDAWNAQPQQGGKARGEGIVIAHPDTGYMRHVEIWSEQRNRIRVADAYDFVEDREDAIVAEGGSTHGTATGSVIMSSVEPVLQPDHVEGVAPLCELIPMRIDDDVIHFRWSNARRAVERAIHRRAHVISMSFGGPVSGPSFHEAIKLAVRNGLIVVAAAGNKVRFVTFPGRYPEVICVAATNHKATPWSGSCRGDAVDVAAPGEEVWRATRENQRDVVKASNGTSYATAVVAGVAALWLAHHGRDNLIAKYGARNLQAVFKELLMTQGVDVPPNWDRTLFGAGIVNAQKVLSARLPERAPSRGAASVRSAEGVAARTQFDEIAHYFPDVPRETVRRNLVQLLKTTDAELETELIRVGEELKLHAAMNPAIRSRIAGEASTGTARGGVAAVAASAEGQSLLSAGLRRRLAI